MTHDLPEAAKQWREVRRIGSQIESWMSQIQTGVVKVDGTKIALATQTVSDIEAEISKVWPAYIAANEALAIALNQAPKEE